MAAVPRDETEHVPLRQPLRPLEQHVLDPVRDPGDPAPLVARPHPIPDPGADNRGAVGGLNQDLEPILQPGLKRNCHASGSFRKRTGAVEMGQGKARDSFTPPLAGAATAV